MATLEEMAESAAVATHDLRTTLEALAGELRETEAGFRLLKGRADEDARQRLARAASRLVSVVESSERQLANARAKFKAIAERLQ